MIDTRTDPETTHPYEYTTLPSANRDEFLRAMSRVFSLVTIVTTDGPGGRCGITVSSASSASADPPLILACIRRRSPMNAAIHKNKTFCVNVLAIGQEHVSDNFSGHPHDGVPFDFKVAEWQVGMTGAPLLKGAVATFDCALHSAHGAGSHTVFIGRVLHIFEEESWPLIYGRRGYGRPTTIGD